MDTFHIGHEHQVDHQQRAGRALARICVLFFMSFAIIIYHFSIDLPDSAPPVEVHKTPGIKFNDAAFSTVKIYVHQALTLPRTTLQLAGMVDIINVEPSRILGIEKQTTLRWERDADNALNLAPSNTVYGLTSIYAHTEKDHDVFTAVMRMPLSVCNGLYYSWTCQKNERHELYDNSYCVVLMQSESLQTILDAARDATQTEKIRLEEPYVIGAFCGNPMLQRITAGRRSVYLLNRKKESQDPDRDYLLCRFSKAHRELSQCTDVGMKKYAFGMPLALMYSSAVDTAVTVQYQDNDTLKLITFDGQHLNPKAILKAMPSSSGFLMYSNSYEGSVIFHADLTLLEVDTVVDLESGHDLTIGVM
ncbi:hypothetical protein, conserved [Babesia bigemina]|uniref:Uncharacterized protein n=1 Tax=Babesia bigemina TaxID=5866 RepID=A0A061D7K9_BABBI|nr:hypothetical protein, conserved [Babesia bigemina]CDR94874.1 hypothetical protein, conserved [Babesia bigemina]|eukprot:XP_012767060.1 hypothetical protein, conserved [Babesia bigemina]